MNKSFIALIPKVDNPRSFRDFRPIYLIGSLYKILAKILANRLRKIMHLIIGESQMTFVRGRKIINSFIVASDIINEWKRDKEGGFLLKLDFEKAYDYVDHSFIDEVLVVMGFRVKWRNRISWCISSPMLTITVNSSPTKQFSIERGP
ncbi:hypothetical protein Ddye_032248 [Dipteronia dyeriana]|uniref:Reverse transcriptase domain-containing protein n=1 Tax=Dipteronia dyeriana TaxID=168575 RepID=A0AAD9WND0_9ROSI|nr:hypothetical protein Ddye_032248 [Dipteronia dyeriana]